MYHKKGQAQEILVTFFLLIVLAISTGMVVEYSNSMYVTRYQMEMQLMRYELANSILKKTHECFGNPIVFDPFTECEIPFGDEENTIAGFKLEQLDFGLCNEKVYVSKIPAEYSDVVVYLVSIRDNEINCMGKLQVYI